MTGKTQSNTLRHKRQSGFTLILSLFLLAILASLGVAFGLLVVLETKASYHKRHVIRARENAKTALNQALQKIQEEAGPDQRVTARAEIWANGSADPDPQPATSSQVAKIQGKNIGRQYYTGVWNSKMANSTPSWLVSSQPKSGGDKDHFTHPSYLHRSNYPLSTDLESDPDFVKMVSGSQKDYEDNRKNRLLTPDDSLWLWKSAVQEGQRGSDPKMYRSSGHFAWWAGDEGIKARVNLGFGKIDDWVNKPIATNELQFKKVTPFTAAHNYGFEGIGGLSNLFDFKDELESIPTLHSLIPMEAATSKQVRKIFHDASASNRGVIADVKHGGLKKDLTAALFNDIEFGRFLQGQSRFQDTTQGNLSRKNPDRIFDPLLRASEPGLTGRKTGENPGGPKWEQLRSFTRLYDIVNPNGTAYDTTDDFIPIRDHNDNQHGIAPILTRLQIFFTASYEDTGIDKPCAINGGGSELKRLYRLQFHVLPAVVLWNPYDIRIEPSDFTVIFWRNTFPHNGGGYTNQCFGDYFRFQGLPSDNRHRFYVPIRFKHKMTFKIKQAGFEPGEAKVFSPLFHTPYNPYSPDGTGNLLQEGWRPGHSFYTPNYTQSHTSLDWSQKVLSGDTSNTVDITKLKELPTAPKNAGGQITDESKVVCYQDARNKEFYVTNPKIGVKFSVYSTRRGGFVLYAHDIPENAILPLGQTSARGQSKNPNDPAIDTDEDPIQYMKKLRTHGHSPPWIIPPTFNRRSTRPLVYESGQPPDPLNNSPRDYTLLWGKKYFMRFVDNEGAPGIYFPKRGLRKVRWLGDLNPRSNTFGRSPGEWNLSSRDTTVACFKTGVVNTGVGTYPIATEPNDSEGESPFIGFSEQIGSTRCILFEIPRNENFLSSIGQLMHCNFTADYGDKTTKEYFRTGIGMREFFSDNIGPAYALGNSLTPVWLTEPNRDFKRFDVRDNSTPYGGWLYDKSYLLNDALWDRFYFSGVSSKQPMGYFIDPDSGDITQYDPADKAASEHVPGTFNPRVGYFWGKRGMPLPSEDQSSDWYKMGERIKKHDLAATNLAIEGPFNVNSTSVDAWRALLSSFWATPAQMAFIFKLGPGSDESSGHSGSPFLRTHGVYSEKFKGSAENGAPLDNSNSPSAYQGYRQLHQLEIEALAQKIVKLVKQRGPFKSMSEFINRNLKDRSDWRYKGTLQEAIDTTRIYPDSDGDGTPDSGGGSTYRINERFFDEGIEHIDTNNGDNNYNLQMLGRDVANRSISTGVPGYLTQADILARLGHVLTVRSDTFLIRAYGDSVARAGIVARQEVCEAVIQRFPEYFDESKNEAHESISSGETVDPRNQKLGRKFRVVSFRWLSREEI